MGCNIRVLRDSSFHLTLEERRKVRKTCKLGFHVRQEKKINNQELNGREENIINQAYYIIY